MSDFEIMESGLDPHLLQMLKAYALTAERDPEAAHRSQERFLAILDTIFDEPAAPKPAGGSPYAVVLSALGQLRTTLSAFTGMRAILAGLLLVAVFTAFLFGSAGMTVYASGSSLPGDALYPVKTRLEALRAGLTFDPAARAHLYREFAGRRLSEIQSLLQANRADDIALAAGYFEKDIYQVVNAIESLSQTDPARAIAVRAETILILRGYTDFLNQILSGLPPDIQPFIQSAIVTSQSAVGVLDFDDGLDDVENGGTLGTPATQSGNPPQATDTPQSLPQASPTLQAAGGSTPLPAATEAPPATATPIPPPTQAGGSGPIVQGGDGTCQGFLGAVTVENLEVPQGASCMLNGTRVQGNIFVRNGASLTAHGITVNGNIQAEGARLVEVLAGSSVGGSIQLKQGGSARVENVRVTGDIQFESNNGVFTAAGNQVGGNIQVFQNVGGATIAGNFVNGNLQCKENSPPPGGGNNTVQGNKEDQCAGL